MDVEHVGQNGATVVVVDADSTGYAGVAALACDGALTVRFLAEGRAALRYANHSACLVWLIGTQLQDMSGFDLHEMIRDRISDAAVCIVGAQYREEDEVRAYRAGATMYLQKPVKGIEFVQRILSRRDAGPSQLPVKETLSPIDTANDVTRR
jgi:DNA-binding response OmpR family regulator